MERLQTRTRRCSRAEQAPHRSQKTFLQEVFGPWLMVMLLPMIRRITARLAKAPLEQRHDRLLLCRTEEALLMPSD
jgi:hypothetical protein